MPIPASQVFSGGESPASEDSGPISAKDFFAKRDAAAANKPPSIFSPREVAKGAAHPFKDYWSTFKHLAGQHIEEMKKDFGNVDKQETIVGQISEAAKGWIDLAQTVWSPAEAGVEAFASHPIQHAVRLAGDQVEKLAADDDLYTPQERREASLAGKPLPPRYTSKITKSDVRRTVEGLNQFIDIGLQTAAGLAGAEGMGGRVRVPGPEDLPKSAPVRKEPTIGPSIDKPRIQSVGTDAKTGKPRVRIVSPEAASAKVSQGAIELHIESVAPKGWDKISEGYGYDPYAATTTQGWYRLGSRMTNEYEELSTKQQPISSRVLLGRMMSKAESTYEKAILMRLNSAVPDMEIKFTDEIFTLKGEKTKPSVGGVYTRDPATGVESIQIRAGNPSAITTHHIVHELTHAATARFISQNPEHVLVKELEDLRRSALLHLKEASEKTGDWQWHYGLTNAHEFVAEAMTNAKFQRFLTQVKGKGETLFNRLANIVRKMLGMPEGMETGILPQVMRTSEDIIRAQTKMSKASRKAAEHAMDVAPISKSVARGTTAVASRLAGYVDELLRAVAPETRSDAAKAAGAVIASRIAERVHSTAAWQTGSKARLAFWQSHVKEGMPFISFFEKGAKFKDPTYAKLSDAYRTWSRNIFERDTLQTGIRYEARDNYLTHIFEDSTGVADFFAQRFGKRWGDPGFTKDREFELYEEAIKAGYVPRFKNPEEIMLARQFASDVAHMQVGILEDLANAGLAIRKEPGVKIDLTRYTPRRGPNGQKYWVQNDAFQILSNAFDSTSLWSARGAVGDAYRGFMWLKNRIVPARLAGSGFHALHVVGIDNAASMQLALKGVLSGNVSPLEGLWRIVKAGALYESLWKNPRLGSRLVQVWDGKVPKEALTEADAQALQFMIEGGFTPKLSSVYRTNADQSFLAAWRGHEPLKAAWHAPWALLSTLNKPIMEHWIPNLKAASYTRQVAQALKSDPSLLDSALARQLVFRKIAKSVDNRYGEMSYDTLFWKRYLKDLAVANTLSLGWQMGFIREYGGGALDVGQFVTGSDKLARVRKGQLDRPLFVAAYTTTALAYGGLMTYALSGKSPQSLMDYVFPVVGENPDGSSQRVNTMYYTREFGSIYKHMVNEGVVSGLTDLVASKGSGVVGLVGEWARGVNQFGQEIADPDAPFLRSLGQKIAYTLTDLEPISTKAIRETVGEDTAKRTVLNLAGFTPAAKFLTESKTEAQVRLAYGKYIAPKQTPFDRAQYSDDFRMLKKSYDSQDESFGDKLDAMTDRFGLNSDDRARIMRRLRSSVPASIRQFEQIGRVSWTEQKKLLDQMTPEEREIYLPHSDKKHLRHHYEEPVE